MVHILQPGEVSEPKERGPFCPLCGAHELEAEEGVATDATILEREQAIRALFTKLMLLLSK